MSTTSIVITNWFSQRPGQNYLYLVLLLGLTLSYGCGGTGTTSSDPSKSRVAVIARLIERYRIQKRGSMPTSLDELKSFAREQGEAFVKEANVASADELFVSERDGQPIVVRLGKLKPPKDPMDPVVTCHEQRGVNGQRIVAYQGGAAEEVDDARFQQLVPAS